MNSRRQNPADENGIVGTDRKPDFKIHRYWQPGKSILANARTPAQAAAPKSIRVMMRRNHPTLERLLDYYAISKNYVKPSPASITQAEFQKITRHLDDCAFCVERLAFVKKRFAETNRVLKQAAPPFPVSEPLPPVRVIPEPTKSGFSKVRVLALILTIILVVSGSFFTIRHYSEGDAAKTLALQIGNRDVEDLFPDWRSMPDSLGPIEQAMKDHEFEIVLQLTEKLEAGSLEPVAALHVELYRLVAGAMLSHVEAETGESGRERAEMRLRAVLTASGQFAAYMKSDGKLEREFKSSEEYGKYFYCLAKAHFMLGQCDDAHSAASTAAEYAAPEFQAKTRMLVEELTKACPRN